MEGGRTAHLLRACELAVVLERSWESGMAEREK